MERAMRSVRCSTGTRRGIVRDGSFSSVRRRRDSISACTTATAVPSPWTLPAAPTRSEPGRTWQYRDLVQAGAPSLYLRFEEVGPQSSAAANRGLSGPAADALSFLGQKRGLTGALAGSPETATGYTAIDQQSCDGGVPTHVP